MREVLVESSKTYDVPPVTASGAYSPYGTASRLNELEERLVRIETLLLQVLEKIDDNALRA